MAFGTQDETDDVMNEINMTPLVDVMLVLLIIFIITVPVMKHSVNIDLPRASSEPQDTKPETIRLSVDAAGHATTGTSSSIDDAGPARACSRPRRPRSRSPNCTSAATRKCATSAWRRPCRRRSEVGPAQDRLHHRAQGQLATARRDDSRCEAYRRPPDEPSAAPSSRATARDCSRPRRAPSGTAAEAHCCRRQERWRSATTARSTACRRPGSAS